MKSQTSNFRKYKIFLISAGICGIPFALSMNSMYKYNNFKNSLEEREKNKNEIALLENKPVDFFNRFKIPSRIDQLKRLEKLEQHHFGNQSQKQTNSQQMIVDLDDADKELDVIVIGGGATGSGVCLDAQSRGLKCALFERDDFSSGTSSKSTKLIHGGIRYLESAILNLDIKELDLVKEALKERSNLLSNAPHLSRPLPILIPIYHWIDLPKFWIGTKLYDFFYPFNDIPGSYYMSKEKSLEKFPYLKEGLLGSIIYYDGQHNDSRMNVGIALSAANQGSIVLNYAEVTGFLKSEESPESVAKIQGVVVKDRLTGKSYRVKAKCVINATGPFSDSIRRMDNPMVEPIIAGSTGVHIVLPSKLCPPDIGFLNPNTKDGRVLFILPFEGKSVAGTTDEKCQIHQDPKPTESEVDFILETIKEYTKDGFEVSKSDITSTWSGIRPLAKQESRGNGETKKIIRSHGIRDSPSGLISIVGGKWTTYRAMSEETVDYAVQKNSFFTPRYCVTPNLKLYGGAQYFSKMDEYLQKRFNLPSDVAKHLAHSYGDQSPFVAELAMKRDNDQPRRLVEGYPYLEAEVVYAVQNEYAVKAQDILARRTRLSFLDYNKSMQSLPKIIDIMAPLLNWNQSQKDQEMKNSINYLNTFNYK
ncbi:Glycerol-3-phosphate dehydrogenase [Tieghemostelium lacteum]|uniref:glycerol-3-phosphate dehydrogenase n=1 Tax=Tieghemostelium lacteum TaxID=361077 RepID=A0A152A1X7_TIELA|nr:Glycerol-3-phosphate dehydrogenase [Tieghemostelium lacteum]|eukprot:KYR00095.1 Glycerol-3-phosphate dehydrogenase [Tieghemostelium lacteum]